MLNVVSPVTRYEYSTDTSDVAPYTDMASIVDSMNDGAIHMVAVKSGVTISSTSTSTPAMTITVPGTNQKTLLVNDYRIYGKGGAGGAGGIAGGAGTIAGDGSPGGNGGNALTITGAVCIYNKGTLGGGGGGNGGSGTNSSDDGKSCYYTNGSAGSAGSDGSGTAGSNGSLGPVGICTVSAGGAGGSAGTHTAGFSSAIWRNTGTRNGGTS